MPSENLSTRFLDAAASPTSPSALSIWPISPRAAQPGDVCQMLERVSIG